MFTWNSQQSLCHWFPRAWIKVSTTMPSLLKFLRIYMTILQEIVILINNPWPVYMKHNFENISFKYNSSLILSNNFILEYHYVACWIVHMMVFFAIQKLFSFTMSHFSNVFLSANGIEVRKSFLVPTSSRLFPDFSSIRFRIFNFMLRSLNDLELNFLRSRKYRSIWFLLHTVR